MARRSLVRCPACGAPKNPVKLGVDLDGGCVEASYDTALVINEVGGRGMCTWHDEPLPLPAAKALLVHMRAATARLEAEIAAAEGDVSSTEVEAA